MGALEILLIIACAGIVIAVSVTSIIKKKQGKHDCDCGGDCAPAGRLNYSYRMGY